MKEKIIYNGIELDSKEELEFFYWLIEAKKVGYVIDYKYHPIVFELTPKQTIPFQIQMKTKSKVIDKFLLNPHRYEPDWEIKFSERFHLDFDHGLYTTNDSYLIDVKGSYNRNHAHRIFSVDQKLVYDKY